MKFEKIQYNALGCLADTYERFWKITTICDDQEIKQSLFNACMFNQASRCAIYVWNPNIIVTVGTVDMECVVWLWVIHFTWESPWHGSDNDVELHSWPNISLWRIWAVDVERYVECLNWDLQVSFTAFHKHSGLKYCYTSELVRNFFLLSLINIYEKNALYYERYIKLCCSEDLLYRELKDCEKVKFRIESLFHHRGEPSKQKPSSQCCWWRPGHWCYPYGMHRKWREVDLNHCLLICCLHSPIELVGV